MPSKHLNNNRRGSNKLSNNNGKPPSGDPIANQDHWHSIDHPCCQKLSDIAEKMFGDHNQEPDAFSTLLRDYMMVTTLRQASPLSLSSLAGKKKKRKKKKKKANGESTNDLSHTPNDSTNADNTTTADPTDNDPPVVVPHGFCWPRERLLTLWNDYLLSTTTDEVALQRAQGLLKTAQAQFSETTPLPPQTIDAIAVPYIRQEMIERRLDRVIATFLSDPRFVLSPRSASAGQELTEFLTRIVRSDGSTTTAATTGTTTTTTTTTSLNNIDDPFFVPLQTVENALSDIICYLCRAEAKKALDLMTTKPVLELTGATFETVLDDYTTNICEDLDFMDQIMEEGHLPASPNGPRWSFVAVEHGNAKGFRLTRPMEVEPWSASDLEFLLKHYLLLMGFPAERFFPDTSADIQSDKLAGDVDDKVKAFLSSMKYIENCIGKAKLKVDAGKPLSSDDAINLDRFGYLREADEACNLVFNDLLGMAIRITNAVNFVQAQYGRDSTHDRFEIEANVYWATRQCYLMWAVFLDGLGEVLHKLNDYEESRFAKADRQGGLEEMYISPVGRRDYHAFVLQKVCSAESASKKFKERLEHPTPLGNSAGHTGPLIAFISRLFIEESFFRVQLSTQLYRDPHQDINQAFEDVMTVLRELAETVHARNIERIVDENMIRWSKFWRVAGGIVACLQDRPKVDGCFRHDQYEKQTHDLHRKLIHILKVGQEDEEEDGDDAVSKVVAWRKHACVYMKTLAESWSSLATFAYIANGLETSPGISRLTLWTLDEKISSEANPLIGYEPCDGSCGERTRRLSCCLVAATFESIIKRYEEYQSHQAMQELLVDTENKAASKKGTKKKRKKTIGLAQQSENVCIDIGDAINVVCSNGDLENEPVDQDGDKADLENPGVDDVSEQVSFLPLISTNIPDCSSTTSADVQEHVDDEAEASAPNNKTANLSCYDDEIGVYDGTAFIKAESFLLGRLEALLKSEVEIVFVG